MAPLHENKCPIFSQSASGVESAGDTVRIQILLQKDSYPATNHAAVPQYSSDMNGRLTIFIAADGEILTFLKYLGLRNADKGVQREMEVRLL